MNLKLNERVVIVTGAASGLGLAVCRTLLAEGARVALCDVNAAAVHETAAGLGSGAKAFPVDVTSEEQTQEVAARILNEWGRLDGLVNSAGITGETNIKSHEIKTENLRKVFEINFMGSYLMAKAVLPQMVQSQYGRILHVASIAGKEGNAGMLAYSSSKAAVIGMTKVQGKEYAEMGITVNALAPAVIQTPLVDAMPEAQVKYMTDKIPMKRCGTLEELAQLAAYIVSPLNSFTTGFTFDLSGGRATY
jgi:2-dehydro-3-deoxy-L-rhamnonate dehydrogenase (NAD+)